MPTAIHLEVLQQFVHVIVFVFAIVMIMTMEIRRKRESDSVRFFFIRANFVLNENN